MLIKSITSFAVGQNGHWRATDTTFNEQKDGDGNVITWDVETFNMVWVYDTKDDEPELEPSDSPFYNTNQRYVVVGYTGDNIPGVDDTTVKYYNYWPSHDMKSTSEQDRNVRLPWLDPPTNTVKQAWEWNVAGTHNSPSSPTRTESYVDGDNVATFARGAGDNDGRWVG